MKTWASVLNWIGVAFFRGGAAWPWTTAERRVMRTRQWVLTVACALPLAAPAQSLGYSDADSPSEAVGMMKMTVLTSEHMQRECTKRYPQQTQDIARNLEKWRRDDAEFIHKAESHWAALMRMRPSLAQTSDYAVTAVMKNFETLQAMPGGAGAAVVAQYCKQHFEDFASGIWRTRTPRAYSFLNPKNTKN